MNKLYFIVFPKNIQNITNEVGSYHIDIFLNKKILGSIYTYLTFEKLYENTQNDCLLLNTYLEDNGIEIPLVSQDDTEFCNWLMKNLTWKVYSESFEKYVNNDLVILEEPTIISEKSIV